jgi:hypothetical protein
MQSTVCAQQHADNLPVENPGLSALLDKDASDALSSDKGTTDQPPLNSVDSEPGVADDPGVMSSDTNGLTSDIEYYDDTLGTESISTHQSFPGMSEQLAHDSSETITSPLVQLTEKYSDPAFDRYVDFSQLTAAFAHNDSSALVDVLLALAEAERVLGRSHKSGVTSDDLIKHISTYVARNADEELLSRMEKRASDLDKQMWSEVLSAAKEFASASRAEAPSIPLDQLAGPKVMEITSIIEAIRVAELQGNNSAFDGLEISISESNNLADAEKQYLMLALSAAQTHIDEHAANASAAAELLEEYGSASRAICTKCTGLGRYLRGFNFVRCDRCGGDGQVEQGGIGGFTGYDSNKPKLMDSVKSGGWKVAWADDVSETDVLEGVVAAGVSVYSGNPAAFLEWVRRLVNRTISSLVNSAQNRFPNEIRGQAERFAADIIRNAIRGQSPQEVFRRYGTVDFKAGAIKYSGANYLAGRVVTRTWGMKPYVAFRWSGSSNGGGGGSNSSGGGGGDGGNRIDYTISNDTNRTIQFQLPTGRWYTLRPGETRPYRNTGSNLRINIPNSRSGTYALSSGRWHIIPLDSNTVGFGKW